MIDNKLLQQEEIDALLNGNDIQQKQPENDNGSDLTQDEIDKMLRGAQDSYQLSQSDKDQNLDQNDIDALIMTAQNDRQELLERQGEDLDNERLVDEDEQDNEGASFNNTEALIDLTSDLTVEEKDALGEIGNISMGSSATTLSQLLNKRVQITSPKVIVTNQDDFLISLIVLI